MPPKNKESDDQPSTTGPEIAVGIMEKEVHSDLYPPEQPPVMKQKVGRLDEDDGWERPIDVLPEGTADDGMSVAEMLAFMEEPVVVYIQPNMTVQHPQPSVMCWVNGKGAEVYNYQTKTWTELGVLPVGRNVTTRRKYVEVLACSRIEQVTTKAYKGSDGEAYNELYRHQSAKNSLQIIHDWNREQGPRWFEEIMRRRM